MSQAFDRTVVTASADCPDAFGVCDVAIGAFGPEESIAQGSRRIVVADWSAQLNKWDQQRWEYLFDTGLVSKTEAQAWAEEVWPDPRADDEENEELAELSRCQQSIEQALSLDRQKFLARYPNRLGDNGAGSAKS
jgi:hypothetical protein